MDSKGLIKRLGETPITELNLGKASLRRAIKNSGFDYLTELLTLSEKDIDRLFEWREADEIVKMRERYLEDPEAFALSVLEKREPVTTVVEGASSKEARTEREPAKLRRAVPARAKSITTSPASMPPLQFSESLRATRSSVPGAG